MNYKNNKIYLISSQEAPGHHCFISSTTQKYLCQRFEFHRSNYKKFKNKCNEMKDLPLTERCNFVNSQYRKSKFLYKLFDEYNMDNIYIKLLEEYPCDSKDAQKSRELYYINTMPNINKKGFKGHWDVSEDEDEEENE